MAKGSSPNPTSSVVWLRTTSATTAGRDAAEKEEDQDEANDDDRQSNPSAPVIPGVLSKSVHYSQFKETPLHCMIPTHVENAGQSYSSKAAAANSSLPG